jgi:hypothetical protein
MFQRGIDQIKPLTLLNKNQIKNVNSLQSADTIPFKVIDSLANAYSYYSNQLQPFGYHIPSNTLYTIKRGYVDTQVNTSYGGTNTKDNIFILQSTDWGITWSAPTLVFDAKANAPTPLAWGTARYPSVYAFEWDGLLTYVFTAPTNNSSGWWGYINGIYNVNTPSTPTHQRDITINGTPYFWFGTGSKILGGVFKSDNPYGLVVGNILPKNITSDRKNNNNLAYRKSNDNFDDWPTVIPPQWTSDKFNTNTVSTNDSATSCSIVNFKYGKNNSMYFMAEGDFVAGAGTHSYARPAYSVSNDSGITWSEFNIAPASLIDSIINTNVPNNSWDSTYVSNYDAMVWDNGDVSFATSLDVIVNGVVWNNLFEIYFENGTWGARKIATHSGYTLYFYSAGVQASSQVGIELQMSKTVDGKGVICKWVDLITPQNTALKSSNDVFVCARTKGMNNWGNVVNVTNSDNVDRITWLPDYIPSDFKNIPILEIETVPDPSITDPTSIYNRQIELESYPQYVMMGHFDASVSLGVDDNTTTVPLQLNSVSPNPADNSAAISFDSPVNGNVRIDLFNAMGQIVKNIYNDNISVGPHSITANVVDLPSGAYYCTITANGQKITKLITVIH